MNITQPLQSLLSNHQFISNDHKNYQMLLEATEMRLHQASQNITDFINNDIIDTYETESIEVAYKKLLQYMYSPETNKFCNSIRENIKDTIIKEYFNKFTNNLNYKFLMQDTVIIIGDDSQNDNSEAYKNFVPLELVFDILTKKPKKFCHITLTNFDKKGNKLIIDVNYNHELNMSLDGTKITMTLVQLDNFIQYKKGLNDHYCGVKLY